MSEYIRCPRCFYDTLDVDSLRCDCGYSSASVGPARVFADADNNGLNARVLPEAPSSNERLRVHEDLRSGGSWLGVARSHMQRAIMGDRLIWGSTMAVNGLSVWDIEEMARQIAVEAILEDRARTGRRAGETGAPTAEQKAIGVVTEYQRGFDDGFRRAAAGTAEELRDTLEWFYAKWEDGDFHLSNSEEQRILALIPMFPSNHRAPETTARRFWTVGNPCGVCASGIIGSRGGHLVCANCGWYPPGSWTSNTTSDAAKSPDGALSEVAGPYTADNGHSNGVAADDTRQASGEDELTVKFPRAWAPYLQAVILGALGDFDGEGDCRWHLNELAKFLGNSALKANCQQEGASREAPSKEPL